MYSPKLNPDYGLRHKVIPFGDLKAKIILEQEELDFEKEIYYDFGVESFKRCESLREIFLCGRDHGWDVESACEMINKMLGLYLDWPSVVAFVILYYPGGWRVEDFEHWDH